MINANPSFATIQFSKTCKIGAAALNCILAMSLLHTISIVVIRIFMHKEFVAFGRFPSYSVTKK